MYTYNEIMYQTIQMEGTMHYNELIFKEPSILQVRTFQHD